MLGQSARTYRGTLYLFRGGGLSSLRKRQFLLALRRLGRFARRNETSLAAKNQEKRMFSQARD